MNPVHLALLQPASLPKNGALVYGVITSFIAHAFAAACLWAVATKPHVPLALPILVNLITATKPSPTPQPAQQRHVLRQPAPPQSLPDDTPQRYVPAPTTMPAPSAPAPMAAMPSETTSSAVVPPRFDAAYLDNPPPPYPSLARRLGEQGRVTLRVLVSAEGAAAQVELKNSSGSLRLDQSALGAVKRWRFVPAKQGTQAIAAWVLIPISFTLGG